MVDRDADRISAKGLLTRFWETEIVLAPAQIQAAESKPAVE